jgi:hypothetical protein
MERVVPWWKQVFGYLGVCVVEALLAALLILLHVAVVIPSTAREPGVGALCAVFGLLILGPGYWLASVVLCVLAKVVVVLLPERRRHWALPLYWGLALAVLVKAWHPENAAGPDGWRGLVVAGGFVVTPALVLTLSHFLLLPRVAPGGTALAAMRALVGRAPKGAPQGPTVP